MKRFWIVLLSLGLIVAFGTTVFAADAKFNGEFKMQGWYNKNASLIDQDSTVGSSYRGSSAFYTQRLRMGIDIEVAKGLKLGTRFDALERKWMAARKAVLPNNGIATTDNEQENIGFEIAYVQFFLPFGIITAGNVPASQFGTPFNDYVAYDNPIIAYTFMKGPWVISASLKKSQDGVAYPGTAIGGGTDFDSDSYTMQVQNRWKTGNAGAQLTYVRSRTSSTAYTTDIPFSVLFVRQKLGKLFIEDEALIILGFQKYLDMVNPAATDVKNGLSISNYFNINVDLSPAKIGFMFVYSPGDDPTTLDKREGGYHQTLGNDKTFNPALILFNNDYVTWMGGGPAGNAVGLTTHFDNVWFYQIYGDFNITPKLNLGTSFTYAYADEKPSAAYIDKDYGYELDVTMKYKIFANLEYMIGAAYLWTGDYFKGTNSNVKLFNNYLITHKLTLTF
ncbi:MAG: hypothetical protein JW943_03290 [Deltaproteobacteria bacterium]|nr:hypothetical protein [Deltaproteobacteria bacterium]